MDGVLTDLVTSMRRAAMAAAAAAVIVLPAASSAALARGPESIADVAEKVIDAVVNISTSQNVEGRNSAIPQLPPGSPFEEFFDEFFKNRRGQGDNRPPGDNRQGDNRPGDGRPGGRPDDNRQGDNNQNRDRALRRVNSLGSGFIIDASGIVVTNNHVISEADEISVILNDGTRLKATLIGRDQKTDLALLQVKPDKPLKAVKFGDSDKLRLGEWVVAN